MKLFDFIKLVFSNSEKYENLTKYERGKNRFLLQRFMAIKYPSASNKLNINGSNPTYINDCFRMIGRRFSRTPGWVYTRVRKQKKKDKKVFEPQDFTIEFYLKKNEATMRDYKELLKTPRKEEMFQELKELEKLLEENGYSAEY